MLLTELRHMRFLEDSCHTQEVPQIQLPSVAERQALVEAERTLLDK